jgi:hypothetical protein
MVRPNYSKDALASPRAQRLRKELEGVLRPEKPRWKTSYKGPDPNRQKIDGKAIVSREELADFRKRFGADKTLRDLLTADATGKLPTPVATGSGRGEAAGRKAEDRDVYRPTPKMERELAEMKRPGRDAIEPTLGPEMGLAALGRAGAGALMRGLAGAFGRSATREAAKDRPDPPLYDAPKIGGVFRSARPRKEDIPTLTDEVTPGLKKGGSTKAYAKGGSVRGGGCETRTKKTRYI